jgi:ABC-2 type transport system permease protein
MTSLIRAEALKLRTLRSTPIALLGLLLLAGGVVGGSMSDAGSPNMTTPHELREGVLAAVYLTSVFLTVMFATHSAGEFRHRTAAQAFLAEPVRGRVLTAKLAVAGLLGLVLGAVVVGMSLVIALPLADAKGLSLGLDGADGVRLVAGSLVAVPVFAMLGVVVGTVVRNPTTAAVGTFALLLAEKLFGGSIGDAGAVLPFGLLESAIGLTARIPWGLAAAGLVAGTLAAAALTARTSLRRDVA